MMLLKTLSDLYQYSAISLGSDRIHTYRVSRVIEYARSRELDYVAVNLANQERRIIAWYQSLKLADSG